jgi:pimeloyl-ACP methyl ester carboxylesterase
MISWEESGTGAPIVFVHGITEDPHAWHSVVPLLDDTFRCIRLDLRCHGHSADADDYSPFFVVTAHAASAPVRGVVNVDQSLHIEGFARAVQSIDSQLRGSQFPETFNAIVEPLMTDEASRRATGGRPRLLGRAARRTSGRRADIGRRVASFGERPVSRRSRQRSR